ncbi:MAG: SBBP repeat-containing protein, partial [Gemmatimonadales bacterium]
MKQQIGLVCALLLAAGCRDAGRLSGPRLEFPLALATGASNPVLFYSTYLGGADDDDGRAIAVDADGNAYVTGETASLDFPSTAGAFRATGAGLNDVVVTKLDPTGSALVYSTYLGGSRNDAGHAIAVDAAGYAYVGGRTGSETFPTTAGAFQPTSGPISANTSVGFVTKLDPNGSALVYSTYLGGTTDDEVEAIAVDGTGRAYVTGVTASSDFPTTVGAFGAIDAGQTDAFVTALNATGSALVYSTYLGGGSTETGSGIAVDGEGQAYVTGRTTSPDFPTTAGAFQTTKTTGTTIHAAFVIKLNSAGSALVYSTYLAGTGSDRGAAIALDAGSSPNAYVAGKTSSFDFPTTAGAFQTTLAGLTDAFVTKLNPSGSALVYSTYLGGADDDDNEDIAIDGTGSVYVVGLTASVNFPVTAGAIQPTMRGLTDGFVSKLDPSGSTLPYSTYLGGTGEDEHTAIALDADGSLYVVGTTESIDFPTTAGAFDTTFGGLDDMVVVKLSDFGPPATLTLAPSAASSMVSTQHCITATVRDAAANAVSRVTVRFAVTGVHSTGGAATTDSSGQAPFCYTGTQVGNDTITAFADADGSGVRDLGEPSGTATQQWVAPPATLTLAPSAATNLANTQQCVTATARDTATNLVPGVTVRFAVTGVDSTGGSATTDANGQAPFCYTGTQVGDDTIAAFADPNASGVQDPGEPSGTATKTWVIGPPATLTLAPSAASSMVNTQHCVTATVRDSATNPVSAVTVRFAVTGGHSTGGSATTAANGQAPFCYTGTQVGDDAITAFADTNASGAQDPGEPNGTATNKWVGPPATLTLAPSAATNLLNTQHCVTATARDTATNPVPRVTVRFAVTGVHSTGGSASTNANGQAPFCYTGTQVGDDAITAFADANASGVQDLGEPSGTATTKWVIGPPATLTLAPGAAGSVVNTQHCVTAAVRDSAANPVPSVTVRFAVTGAHSTGGSATTTASGQAPFCYTGTQVGDDAITAFADANASGVQDPGEPSGMATQKWVGPPATLTLAPSAATNLANTQHCVTATARDTATNPVPRVTVRFAVTGAHSTGGSAST